MRFLKRHTSRPERLYRLPLRAARANANADDASPNHATDDDRPGSGPSVGLCTAGRRSPRSSSRTLLRQVRAFVPSVSSRRDSQCRGDRRGSRLRGGPQANLESALSCAPDGFGEGASGCSSNRFACSGCSRPGALEDVGKEFESHGDAAAPYSTVWHGNGRRDRPQPSRSFSHRRPVRQAATVVFPSSTRRIVTAVRCFRDFLNGSAWSTTRSCLALARYGSALSASSMSVRRA